MAADAPRVICVGKLSIGKSNKNVDIRELANQYAQRHSFGMTTTLYAIESIDSFGEYYYGTGEQNKPLFDNVSTSSIYVHEIGSSPITFSAGKFYFSSDGIYSFALDGNISHRGFAVIEIKSSNGLLREIKI